MAVSINHCLKKEKLVLIKSLSVICKTIVQTLPGDSGVTLPSMQEMPEIWVLFLGRSPGGGHGNPLQYSCLENPTDRGVWQATVHGISELDTTEVTEHSTAQYTFNLQVHYEVPLHASQDGCYPKVYKQ